MRATVLLGLFGMLATFGLTGCDAVFGLNGREDGLDATTSSDSGTDGIMDTPSDGTLDGCPTSGPPSFDPIPKFVINGCLDYTTSAVTSSAMMTCTDIFNEGPSGSNNVLAAMIVVEAGQSISAPRLSPAGDEMFVISSNGALQSIRVYNKQGGQWRHLSSPSGLPTSTFATAFTTSPPTSTSERRVMVHVDSTFREYGETVNSAWVFVREYPAADLGVMSYLHPSLSPDGLHLVFAGQAAGGSGTNEVRYAYRPSTSVKFDTSVKIEVGVEGILHPHLAPDCSRLYFWAGNTVLYVDPP